MQAIFESEGGKHFTIEVTSGAHKYASAEFDLGDGLGNARVGVTVSGSPGDWRAGKKVRANLHGAVRVKREQRESEQMAEVAHA